jgi:glycosyltransferase involved in cell wall biosynthesis
LNVAADERMTGETTKRRVDIVVAAGADAEAAIGCVRAVLGAPNATTFDVIVALDARAGAHFDEAFAASRDTRVRRVTADPSTREALDAALGGRGDRDVVVLAADARVHGDWLDRLVAHARRDDLTGILGTFTNAGGTATYSSPDDRDEADAGAAKLDDVFAAANRGRSVDVAVVRGPCRYFTRTALRALGLSAGTIVDARLATDLSERASRAGVRNAIAGDVYVMRTSKETTNTADDDAADTNTAGGLRTLARRVDLARLAASPRPALVFVSHGWGGGVRRHMQDLAALVADRAELLHLEPAGPAHVRLSWWRAGESFAARFALPEELDALVATLRAAGTARLHFHHVHGMPKTILALPDALDVPYDCTLHDYYAICPQYHLADANGRYCGEPDAAGCAACLAERPPQWGLDIGAWRALFAPFLARAGRVIAPSEDVAARTRRYFPSLSIAVWPHPERALARAPAIVRVVLLGNLSPEKGLDVVAACARDARSRNVPIAFRVLGATARPLPQWPEAPLSVHGSYDDEQLVALLAAERADVLFFPAQVPETYSYTLTVALASGIPIVASAIGAFPERVAGRPNVLTLPLDAPAPAWNEALLAAAQLPTLPVEATTAERPTLRAAS